MMLEVEKANKMTADEKLRKIQEEKDQDLKIAEYNQQRALAEQEKVREAKRIKDEKERETQKLREMQEKAADRQSEIDALRAKRHFEQMERNEREKERQLIEKKKRQLDELEVARQRQFALREANLALQAKQERDEFVKIITEQKIAEDQERLLDEKKYQTFRKHAQDIRNQIVNNDEIKKQGRQDYLEEGRQVRDKIE